LKTKCVTVKKVRNYSAYFSINFFVPRLPRIFPAKRKRSSNVSRLLIYRLIVENAMQPTDVQQLAIQARLSMQVDPKVFDSMFAGMEVAGLSNGELRILVRSQHCANVIEQNYLGTLAVIAEAILKRPVKSVTVVPKNVRGWTEQ
jgi:hypothetical protein